MSIYDHGYFVVKLTNFNTVSCSKLKILLYIMKREIVIFVLTVFFVANAYYDGKYIITLKSWKKYYQMLGIAFIGLSTLTFLRKHPNQFASLAMNTQELIKILPIDKEAGDMLYPFMNMASKSELVGPQQKRMMNSGQHATKRCVSEPKKKYVAAAQGWKCGICNVQLPAWYEIDHTVRLDAGGSNHVDNLVALCRDCHGEKTAKENF